MDRGVTYQTIFGFGGSFTDSTGINLNRLGPKLTQQILNDYFSRDGLEYNVGRIPIGGSDYSTRGYSYDDLNSGSDLNLTNFALAKEDIDYKVFFEETFHTETDLDTLCI